MKEKVDLGKILTNQKPEWALNLLEESTCSVSNSQPQTQFGTSAPAPPTSSHRSEIWTALWLHEQLLAGEVCVHPSNSFDKLFIILMIYEWVIHQEEAALTTCVKGGVDGERNPRLAVDVHTRLFWFVFSEKSTFRFFRRFRRHLPPRIA